MKRLTWEKMGKKGRCLRFNYEEHYMLRHKCEKLQIMMIEKHEKAMKNIICLGINVRNYKL
ncbi:hypothetical protein SESBI_38099 [Sesbania bispinosa]|nr:hypothetical protein SESBI_38099 [Sesbania bispinosa]